MKDFLCIEDTNGKTYYVNPSSIVEFYHENLCTTICLADGEKISTLLDIETVKNLVLKAF